MRCGTLVAACILLFPQCSVRSVASVDSSDGTAGDEFLPDVSSDICWTGTWTRDVCCKGDSTTHPDCWDAAYSFNECCPNADCWDGGDTFTYANCCGEEFGEGGNELCWSGMFNYEHCCLAQGTSQSWVDAFFGIAATEHFYAMDEFYTDAQYGNDFGYYSTGHVLRPKNGKVEVGALGTQQFAHYTTYPMALSPHFARVFCRLLFVMWIQLEERAPFRVVEMGAGSGQLSYDVQRCVRYNELGIAPAVWRRWAASFEYLIMERSPALAERQRERGLRVVAGDAQTSASCQPVLAALVASAACAGTAAKDDPECVAGERGTAETGASVVISNELLDAFAPVKLRLSLYGSPNITDCHSWQEIRLVHTMREADLQAIAATLEYSDQRVLALAAELREYTQQIFCGIANSTIGQAARDRLPEGTSCLALVFGLNELMYKVELKVPAASHNMRFRLKKDYQLWSALREVTAKFDEELHDAVVLPRQVYRQLRHDLRVLPDIEVRFLEMVQTHRVSVSLGEDRCEKLAWWFVAHEARIQRLVKLYRPLGYPAVYQVVRLGEKDFIDLTDCVLGDSGGYVLSVDYGASFEALGHSLSIDPKDDGIFIPPVPHELMAGLPHCHGYWPKCAGRIDWTTFVDFTNLAAAGALHGWSTLFYGPQSLLEHVSRVNLTVSGRSYSVPGYSVLAKSWLSNHVRSWYGRETLADKTQTNHWQQRWTSFKTLLLEKPAADSTQRHSNPVAFPTWHLDGEEVDACWQIDLTTVPLADWIRQRTQVNNDPRKALENLTEEINDGLGRTYADAYEEAQLAARLVDWLVATNGCESLRPHNAASLLNSEGLWKSLLLRMERSWGDLWGEKSLETVAQGILERLAKPEEAHSHATPPDCIGHQTYIALCETPGGGSTMWWGPPDKPAAQRQR